MIDISKIILQIFAVLLLMICTGNNDLKAQEMGHFEHSDTGFKLSYPKDFFVSVPPITPKVLLMLRARNSSYPTFNIIFDSGSLGSEADSVKMRSEKIQASYRSVGLTDAKVFDDGATTIGGKGAIFAIMDYLDKGLKIRSIVYVIPLSIESNLIATFTTTRGEYSNSKKIIDELVKTVSFSASENQ